MKTKYSNSNGLVLLGTICQLIIVNVCCLSLSQYHRHLLILNSNQRRLQTAAALVPRIRITDTKLNAYKRTTTTHEESSIKQHDADIEIKAISNHNNNNSVVEQEGIRLNKVFKKTHSRRQADELIASGRVSVNGVNVSNKGGFRVIPYKDIIRLDGKVVKNWEEMNPAIKTENDLQMIEESDIKTRQFEYVKFFKPIGVTCTTEKKIKNNIIDSIVRQYGFQPRHRIYPVGRLDKDSSGLILLTSDGRLVNSVLRKERKQPKIYRVEVDRPISDQVIQDLRDGVVITTYSNTKKRLTAKTKKCDVLRMGPRSVEMTLLEGRNRQIRKMMEKCGLNVMKLHRTKFMGIDLRPLKYPGDWASLDKSEMKLVRNALHLAEVSSSSKAASEY